MGALRSANARDENVLATLQRRFDQRLASLNTPGATKSLRTTMTRRVKLGGKVRAEKPHR